MRYALATIFVIMATAAWSRPAQVVLIRSAGESSAGERQLRVATRFYGLNIKVVTLALLRGDDRTLRTAVGDRQTLAVAVTAEAISHTSEKELLRALSRGPGRSVPLIILGLTPSTSPALVRKWSDGTAMACRSATSKLNLRYVVGNVSGITEQLTSLEIPFPEQEAFYFALAPQGKAQTILSIENGDQLLPVFIEERIGGQSVFLDCAIPRQTRSALVANENGVVRAFAEIAPAIMFVKYCAGARGWHSIHQYANLTVDDAYLREPYGFLDYRGLLREMENHNFHTTVAFIPWNYDRSEAKVAALFRSHPERFSICVHGDNHDHKEFTDYASKPFDVQVYDLRQALVRMNRLRALTGIPYSKVMVFPHSIAPEKTLGALKENGYLATVNSQNVPMGSVRPPGALFSLRPVTLAFADFPSILRYSAAVPIPTYLVAINEFLGNPLFFYCHHECFENGIGAFDGVADTVNKLDPETRWRSLGDMVKHLYWVKLIEDSNYDVLAFATSIDLESESNRESVFHVIEKASNRPRVAAVTADGRPCSFELRDGYLRFSVTIPAHQVRSIAIEYEKPSPLPPVSVAKHSFRVYCLRMASDFRDNELYTNAVGRVIVRLHDVDGIKAAYLVAGLFTSIALLCLLTGVALWKTIKRFRTVAHGATPSEVYHEASLSVPPTTARASGPNRVPPSEAALLNPRPDKQMLGLTRRLSKRSSEAKEINQ